jgi:hypothetical protein
MKRTIKAGTIVKIAGSPVRLLHDTEAESESWGNIRETVGYSVVRPRVTNWCPTRGSGADPHQTGALPPHQGDKPTRQRFLTLVVGWGIAVVVIIAILHELLES